MIQPNTNCNVSGDTPNLTQVLLMASADGHTTTTFIKAIVAETLNQIGINSTESHSSSQNNEQLIRGYRELAKLYNASPASMCKLVNEGKIPVMRVGNRTLFYKSQVDEALARL